MQNFCPTHEKPIEENHKFCEVCEGEHERLLKFERDTVEKMFPEIDDRTMNLFWENYSFI